MEKLPIAIHELKPVEVSFKLEAVPTPLTLCKWSLRVRAWAAEKYTSAGLRKIFVEQDIDKIAQMAWFMLKDHDKKLFEGEIDNFLDAVSSVGDQVALIKAMIATLGIGEPEIKKISDQFPDTKSADAQLKEGGKVDPKRKSTKRKTGPKPSTP